MVLPNPPALLGEEVGTIRGIDDREDLPPAVPSGEDPEDEPEILEGLARDIVSRLAATLFGEDEIPRWDRRDTPCEPNQAGPTGQARAAAPGKNWAAAPGGTASGEAPSGAGPRPRLPSGGPKTDEAAVSTVAPLFGFTRAQRVRFVGGDRPALLVRGTVRSGRQVRHNGDVVVLGDVNPGGQVVAAGDIVVMGTLRGMVHAGATGDHAAVVAAFRLCPTQLRIASCLSRPPEEPGGHPDYPELALVSEGVVVVRPLATGMLARLGPDGRAPEPAEEPAAPLIGKQ
jgi:septum site-determining protein MinC